jgi:hypothetical protein
MSTGEVYLSLIFMAICLLSASVGFSLRKRWTWTFLLFGFIGGVLLGLSQKDLKSGVMIGTLVSVFSMAAASFRYHLKNRYRER